MFPQVGARLLAFHRKWTYITQDQWVLETLREGLKLEFIIQPGLKIKKTSTKLWYSRVGYFNRNKHIIRKRCYRTCTCQSRRRRILQHHFCGAKEARRASDNLKFETSKSVSCASTFQNGDAVFNYEIN